MISLWDSFFHTRKSFIVEVSFRLMIIYLRNEENLSSFFYYRTGSVLDLPFIVSIMNKFTVSDIFLFCLRDYKFIKIQSNLHFIMYFPYFKTFLAWCEASFVLAWRILELIDLKDLWINGIISSQRVIIN